VRDLGAALGFAYSHQEVRVIRKLPSGKYRLYSRKKDAKTGKRKNLGTFDSKGAAEKHERAVQFFKRRG
jgi:hypothetical protein